MKTLIVEDDFVSRILLQAYVRPYGPYDVAVNGKEAVQAVKLAIEAVDPYDLITLDVMMPEMDGQQALQEIRSLEREAKLQPAKIIMTSALSSDTIVYSALRGQSDAYLVKPIQRRRLIQELFALGLVA